MNQKAKFSSTMRIDLTADTEDGCESDPIPLPPATTPPEAAPEKGSREIADQCEIVGSADFSELLQNVYDAAIITNLDGKVIRGNRRAEQFFQYDVSRFADLHITDLLSGSNDELMSTIRKSLKDDRFILIQAYCTRADKRTFPAEISVNLLQISDYHYISFFIRDVTLRKQAEERLRTGHTALQNAGCGIAVTDEHATLQYTNPAMNFMLGISPSQKPTLKISAFLINPRLVSDVDDAVRNTQSWGGELQVLRKDGITLFVQASVVPNLDADGNVVGMVWSLLDVSDQKRIQQELIEYNTQLAEDLNMANEFQQAFIQKDYPVFPPGVCAAESVLEFGHVYIPSGAVGGDFFEVFEVSMSRVGIFISDVMGHGIRSALIVATIRGLFEELGSFRHDPAAFLSNMNRDLYRIINHPGQTMFATAFYMVLDLTNGDIQYAGAGHPSPVHLKAGTFEIKFFASDPDQTDPALGLFPDTEYRAHSFRIIPGDTVIVYTDGITEAEDSSSRSFDTDGLVRTIRQNRDLPARELLEGIVKDAYQFTGKDRFDDDVCMVAMKLRELLSESDGVALRP